MGEGDPRRKRKGRRFRPDQPQNITSKLLSSPNYLQRSIYQFHLILNAIKMILRFPAFRRGQDEARCPELIRKGEGREKKIRFTPCQDFSSDLTSFAERNQKKPPFRVKASFPILDPPPECGWLGWRGLQAAPLTAPPPRCVGGTAPRRATLCCCTLHTHSTTLSFNLNIPKLAN